MEKESFDDDEVAKLMNAAFICIKVYREERPVIHVGFRFQSVRYRTIRPVARPI
jgi:uncharacterized protein YyaL (SSP411 family)